VVDTTLHIVKTFVINTGMNSMMKECHASVEVTLLNHHQLAMYCYTECGSCWCNDVIAIAHSKAQQQSTSVLVYSLYIAAVKQLKGTVVTAV
jgi:hypothetical protein